MIVRVRFFARFRELLGTDIPAETGNDTTLLDIVRRVAEKKKEGYDAIFAADGTFHEFIIVMRNGKRVEHADAAAIRVADGDEIAVFPPVAGG